MDLNSVIVYFPWGAGGNLVKNIISLDTRFEFYDDQEFRGVYPTVQDRYNWMQAYYSKHVTPETWLQREWSIRASSHRQYYTNGVVTYWNPDLMTVYDIHGTEEEINGLMQNSRMLCYDRYKITHEGRPEQFSPWHIQDCHHIFLLPISTQLITEIYNSKNPTLNQIDSMDLLQRRGRAEIINTTMSRRLTAFKEHLKLNSKPVLEYCADKLYGSSGHNILLDIVKRLELDVPAEYVTDLHTIWLRSTRDVYRSYFNKELEL